MDKEGREFSLDLMELDRDENGRPLDKDAYQKKVDEIINNLEELELEKFASVFAFIKSQHINGNIELDDFREKIHEIGHAFSKRSELRFSQYMRFFYPMEPLDGEMPLGMKNFHKKEVTFDSQIIDMCVQPYGFDTEIVIMRPSKIDNHGKSIDFVSLDSENNRSSPNPVTAGDFIKIEFTPDRKIICVEQGGGLVIAQLFDKNEMRYYSTETGIQDIKHMAFTPNGDAYVADLGKLYYLPKLLSQKIGKQEKYMIFKTKEYISSLQVTPDSKVHLGAGKEGVVSLQKSLMGNFSISQHIAKEEFSNTFGSGVSDLQVLSTGEMIVQVGDRELFIRELDGSINAVQHHVAGLVTGLSKDNIIKRGSLLFSRNSKSDGRIFDVSRTGMRPRDKFWIINSRKVVAANNHQSFFEVYSSQ